MNNILHLLWCGSGAGRADSSDERSAGCIIGSREGLGRTRLQSRFHEVSNVSGEGDVKPHSSSNNILTLTRVALHLETNRSKQEPDGGREVVGSPNGSPARAWDADSVVFTIGVFLKLVRRQTEVAALKNTEHMYGDRVSYTRQPHKDPADSVHTST